MSMEFDRRTDFFESIAPYYDILVDLLSFGLYSKFLKKSLNILAPQKGERVLDLCSGTGRATSWIARIVGDKGEVIGMDISRNRTEVARKRYGVLKNVIFTEKDVTEPWGYQNYFDGIFISFSLHEISEWGRPQVIEQSCLALKERGRLVIADFDPGISGLRKNVLSVFFRLFERENLSFFAFDQNEMLRKVGFKEIKIFPAFARLLQVTRAQKD
jgi:demethylmenaquinone methyltransferase/2-methoxy-6-polyprenyl-1,4-benzoquinol methylase